jgi:hypothetical protein
MLGPRGNPQARNLFGIIGYLQKQAGVELHVAAGSVRLIGKRVQDGQGQPMAGHIKSTYAGVMGANG